MTNMWITRFFFLLQTVSLTQDANAHIPIFCKVLCLNSWKLFFTDISAVACKRRVVGMSI